MFGGCFQVFDSDNSLEHSVGIGIFGGKGYNTRTIDQVDSLHQGNVLPDFRLSWDRGDSADLFLFDRIDDARFTDIGVSDETDRYLLLVRMKDRELTEELNEGSFTKRVVDRGVECDGGCREGEVFDPSCLSRVSYCSRSFKQKLRSTGDNRKMLDHQLRDPG